MKSIFLNIMIGTLAVCGSVMAADLGQALKEFAGYEYGGSKKVLHDTRMTAFRGTDDAIDYYKFLRQEVDQRVAAGLGPVTPDGPMGEEKYRLVVEGPPNYTNFRHLWKMFYDEGAVVVASSYT